MSRPESDLYQEIITTLRRAGLAELVRVNPTDRHQRRHAPKGWPDLCGFALRDGRFVGLEIKAPRAKTDPEREHLQSAWRAAMRHSGAIAAQVTSVQEAVDVFVKE